MTFILIPMIPGIRKDVWYVFLVAENDEIFNAGIQHRKKEKGSKKVCLIFPSMNQSQI